MKHKIVAVYCLIIAFAITVSCDHHDAIRGATILYTVYNDTFQINVKYGPGFQDSTVYDTVFYDLNNDGFFDMRAAYVRYERTSETTLNLDAIGGNFLAIDTSWYKFDVLYQYKSYAFGDTIQASDFMIPGGNMHPLEVFNSNPAGLAMYIDTSRVDWNSGVYYLAMMDNSFEKEEHHFGWIKFQLFIDHEIDFFGLIITESGYGEMPMNYIKAGQR